MQLKLNQKLKAKCTGEEWTVDIIAEGGARISGARICGAWWTNKEIKEYFILPKERWVPKKGDPYYYINSYGKIDCDEFENDITDNDRLSFRNVFQTVPEAESARDKIKELLISIN